MKTPHNSYLDAHTDENTSRLSGLSLTASLKAAQVASAFLLYESQVEAMSSRVLVQSALQRYNNGNHSSGGLGTIAVRFWIPY